MGKSIKNKQKASKTKNTSQNNFFGAFVFGLVSCFVLWILLAVVCSLVLLNHSDSGSIIGIVSPIIAALSLVVGGFVVAKKDRADAFLVSVFLGAAVLAICYALSSILNATQNLGPVVKAVLVVGAFVCPVIGAKIATTSKGKNKRKHSR